MAEIQRSSNLPIPMPMDKIADFCRRKNIRKLSLFGSVVKGGFDQDSDIDVLAEFEPGTKLGWEYYILGDELEKIWGRKVDFHTPQEFRPSRRKEVLEKTMVLYEQ